MSDVFSAGTAARARRRGLSLRIRLMLLIVGMSLGSAILLGAFNFQQAWKTGDRNAEGDLKAEAELHAELIVNTLGDVRNVAKVLANAPPLAELVSAYEAGERFSTVSEETRQDWRSRLETLFKLFLAERPSYTQARLILLADGGPEIVRVNASGDGAPVATPPGALQLKGEEPYIQHLSGNDVPAGFFSNVTLNREEGRTDPNRIQTLRFIKTVRTGDGTVIGAIVLNIDYQAMLAEIHQKVRPGHVVTLINTGGDVFEWRPDEGDVSFFARGDGWMPTPALAEIVETPSRAPFVQADGDTAYVVTHDIETVDGPQSSLLVVASAADRVLYAGAYDALNRSIIASTLIILLAGVVNFLFASRMTSPLRDLADRIRKREALDSSVDLDLDGEGEIGDLARAFQGLSNELIARSALSREVFEQAEDGILILDEDGTIFRCNGAAKTLFGGEGLVGRSFGQIVARLDSDEGTSRLDELERPLPESSRATPHDYVLHGAAGNLVPISFSLSVIDVDGRRVQVGVVRDISEEQEAERRRNELVDRLRAAKADLERSNAELDSFAYVASHDLKAPLRVIDNASRWLEEDLADLLKDETRESVDLIRGRVKRMERLLDDLLQHSRIGRERYANQTVSGAEMANFVSDLVDKPPAFSIAVSDRFKAMTMQRMPLQNVILNLVSNAIKHHDRQDGSVRLDVVEEGDWLTFIVEDDGPGIEEKYQKDVFQLFRTLKPRDQVEGSGMGLALVEKTVKTEGGEIALSSKEGEGCLFTFTWRKPNATYDRVA